MEAVDYYGVSGSKYELYNLIKQKLKNSTKVQLIHKPLTEWKSWTIDKCVENLKLAEAHFYLIRNNSRVLDPSKTEITEVNTERKLTKLPQSTHREDLVQREKILCKFHGLNVSLNVNLVFTFNV